MVLLGSQHPPPSTFIIPSFMSLIFVSISQFALAMVPRYFSSFPFLAKVALSALVLLAVSGFGRCCRRLVRVYASASAFVFFNVLFTWGVYIFVIREAISSFLDVVFNAELSLLMIGYCSDPGLVTHESSGLDKIIENIDSEVKLDTEGEELSASHVCHELHINEAEEGNPVLSRVRYCKHCKAYIWGFDHHCPAFGNCIGQKNHALFIALLIGFIIAEASYIVLSTQFLMESQSMDESVLEVGQSREGSPGGLGSTVLPHGRLTVPNFVDKWTRGAPAHSLIQLPTWLPVQCYSVLSKYYGRWYSSYGIFIVYVSTSKLMSGLIGRSIRSSNSLYSVNQGIPRLKRSLGIHITEVY